MRSAYLPALVLIGAFVLSALAPFLARFLGPKTGHVIGAGYALGAVLLLTTSVLQGEPVSWSADWVPGLGIRFSLLLDGLSLLFSLLVLGIGALVMFYAGGYFESSEGMARFYGLLCLFAASMLGLVLAADLILLFVFWELTSVTSFFLIAGDGGARQKPATRAFLVTGVGGLALLAAAILMTVVVGSSDVATILRDPDLVVSSGLAPAFFALVLLAAFTKSAQVPFHFWLRGAMVAPTPVSTYLHAATMVKAGVYLLARLAPLVAEAGIWREVIVFVGLLTSVIAAAQALKQVDLKALLAYSTVSQLGLLTALAGVATYEGLAALGVLVLAHALYKSTAFMIVGIVDKKAGTRDLRELGGLRQHMPRTAAVAALAAFSMGGLPVFLGFVSKEESFTVLLEQVGEGALGLLASGLALLSAILTFAYAARLYLGIFEGTPRRKERAEDPGLGFLAPAGVAAGLGLILGVLVPILDPLIGEVATSAMRETGEVHLVLWHGFKAPLFMSIVAVAIGAGLFVQRTRVDAIARRIRFRADGAMVFDRLYQGTLDLGRLVGEPFLSTSPVRHLSWVLVTALCAPVAVWFVVGSTGPTAVPDPLSLDWAVMGVIAAGCLLVTRASVRLAAVALLGVVGFLVAVLYVLYGAPDLAITQLLIETLTIALVVFVFRRLPPVFKKTPPLRRTLTGGLALAAGTLATVGAYALTGRREASDAADYYMRAAPEEAGGNNVVNTILVDFRALDTLGEITVLAVAAVGVYSIVWLTRRRRS